MKMGRRLTLVAVVLVLAACSPSVIQPTPTQPPTATQTQTPAPTATSTPLPTPSLPATITPTATPGIGSTWTSPVDGLTTIYVPEGAFLMGSSDSDGMAYPDEKPQHVVTLDAFWIDQTEVTNGAYTLCVQAKACQPPSKITSNVHDLYYGYAGYADFPVLWATWDDAQAYCQWAGGRLPTEAEWEKAARGTDGRIYPWGNNPPDGNLANFNSLLKTKDIVKVGSYPAAASPYGALDMAGNVFEWVADWYGFNYYGQSPDHNPPGPASGTQRVLRGGSWRYDAAGIRAAYRFQKDPSFSSFEVGFRCVIGSTP